LADLLRDGSIAFDSAAAVGLAVGVVNSKIMNHGVGIGHFSVRPK